MNKEIKRQWVEALRSGEYEQGTGYLRDSKNKFCCLGVLCDLYVKQTGNNWISPTEYPKAFHLHGHTNMLPDEVSTWAGLPTRNPQTNKTPLWRLNDQNGLNFDSIAEIIELSNL